MALTTEFRNEKYAEDVTKEKPVWKQFSDYCHNHEVASNSKLNDVLIFTTNSLPSTFRFESLSKDMTDFGMEVLYPLSSKLLGNGKYAEQSLVVLVFDENTSFSGLKKSTLQYDKIVSVFIIERSSNFQGYLLTRLSICPHFTLLTVDLPAFLASLDGYLDEAIEVTFVASDVPFFSHTKVLAMVVNSSYDSELSNEVTKASTELFDTGFGNYFSLQDQGRGDVVGTKELISQLANGKTKRVSITSKDCTVPTLTVGFSNMNCNRYKSSRYTVLGNTRPFIVDGGLSHPCKSAYLNFIEACSKSELATKAFDTSFLPSSERRLRESLINEVYEALGGDLSKDHKWFMNESNADLIAMDQLAPHCDRQNSATTGLDSALVFSCHPPVASLKAQKTTESEIKFSPVKCTKGNLNLHEYVSRKGYRTTFPHTRVHYMKNIVDTYVKKRVTLDEYGSEDTLKGLVVWGLTKTLNTPLDYRGYVFDNDNFPDLFEKDAEDFDEPGCLIKGRHLKLIPAFDKIGYYSIVMEVWNMFVIDILPTVTVLHAVQYAFYCALTSNGTALPWRICVEVYNDRKASQALFKALDNVFLFLTQMDEKVALIQKSENDQMERKQGCCILNRFAPSDIAQSRDWSTECLGLLFIVNVAFYDGDLSYLSGKWKEEAKKKKGRVLVSDYIREFKGIDSFFAHNLMSVLSLLGVIPLRCYEEATISTAWSNNSGTVKLAKAALSANERKGKTPLCVYIAIKKEINIILGSNCLTLVFLENFGCETWRLYSAKLTKIGKVVKRMKDNEHNLDIIRDDSKEGRSKKHDIYFYMPQRHCNQNVFLFTTTSKKFTMTTPGLMMRSSLHWLKGPVVYTDWTDKVSVDGKTPNKLYWKKKSNEPFLPATKLIVTNELREMYYPTTSRPTRKHKKTSFFHKSEKFQGHVCHIDEDSIHSE